MQFIEESDSILSFYFIFVFSVPGIEQLFNKCLHVEKNVKKKNMKKIAYSFVEHQEAMEKECKNI